MKTIAEFLKLKTNLAVNGCFEFTGWIHKSGYGQLRYKGKICGAHRLAYALANNIPVQQLMPTDLVLHACDNPICCNPAHLSLGTPQDNSNDMVARNRAAKPKGQLHPNSKLTDTAVQDIRNLYNTKLYTQKQIAVMFGISHQQVSKIVNKVRWDHV